MADNDGDGYDDETGMPVEPTSPDPIYAPPTSPTGTSGNELGGPWARPDDWAPSYYTASDQDGIRDLVRKTYQEFYGRDPDDGELNGAIQQYVHFGGDAMRSWVSGPLEMAKNGNPAGGGGGGGGNRGFGSFTPPQFDMPVFAPPPAFEYPEWVGPTADNFKADPGYGFRVSEGTKALENNASAAGLARSGGFLKDLTSWREGLASQEFGNVRDRSLQDWTTNLGKKSQDYERSYRDALTKYTLPYQAESDEFTRALSTYGINLDAHNSNTSNLLSLYGLATRNLPSYQPLTLPTSTIPTQ